MSNLAMTCRAGLFLIVVGCGQGDSLLLPSSEPTRLAIQSPPQTLGLRGTVALQVLAFDANGNVMRTPALSWASSNATIAEVNESGVVVGKDLGVATISVAGGTLTATATIMVMPAGLQIQPGFSPLLVPGGEVRLNAVLLDALGTPMTHRPPVVWKSSDLHTVGIAPAAPGEYWAVVAIGLRGGSAIITATAGGVVGTVVVNVRPELSGDSPVLSVVDFRVLEIQYPTHPGWYFYAPQLRLAETSGLGPIDVLRMGIVIPGLPSPIPSVCASIRLEPGSERDIFVESYGDFQITFDAPGHRATGANATATLQYATAAGRQSLTLSGPIVPGDLPTTYTGGNGTRWSGCAPGT